MARRKKVNKSKKLSKDELEARSTKRPTLAGLSKRNENKVVKEWNKKHPRRGLRS